MVTTELNASDGPRPPKSRKGHKTRARLLAAAKEEFEQEGFLEAKVASITARAGLSHGSFYHYFESKEEIFKEVAEAAQVLLMNVDVTGVDNPYQRIEIANRRYLEAYRAESRIMRVIEEVARYNADVRDVYVAAGEPLGSRMRASIQRMQREGLADKRLDPNYAAFALGSMVSRFAEIWFADESQYDFDTAVEQLSILWANALGISTEHVRPQYPAQGLTDS